MDKKEKLLLLEEMLELNEGELNEETQLSDIDNWDSMAKISLIALMDEKFQKTITSEQIKKFSTISDILAELE